MNTITAELGRRYRVDSHAAPPRVLAGLVAALPPLPPSTAPHGPNAARQAADELRRAGNHVHIDAGNGTECLSGCGQPAPTPAEVLL